MGEDVVVIEAVVDVAVTILTELYYYSCLAHFWGTLRSVAHQFYFVRLQKFTAWPPNMILSEVPSTRFRG